MYTSIGFTGQAPKSNQPGPASAGSRARHWALLSVQFLHLHDEHIRRVCTRGGGDRDLMTQHREWWGGPGPDLQKLSNN